MADAEAHAVRTSTTRDGITTITIDRMHRRNAVDFATARKLKDAFVAFDRDASQKVCIFYGAHGIFCAGYDLQNHSRQDDSSLATEFGDYVPNADKHREGHNSGPMGPSRMQLSKPVISAVSGHAVAGGLELSLLGDVRIAEEDAVFGVFCRRFGVPLVDGGTVRLPAVVGLGRALDMILTGRPVPAAEALQFGLVNRVVPRGQALNEAVKMARQLLVFPQATMNVDRSSCYYSVFNASSFEDAMQSEWNRGLKVLGTDAVRGAANFTKGAGRHGSFEPSKM
ncbi:hypothetical protein CDD81_1659 [Ophiocordyceps australis]|uniref:Enoyl-CoA hydratase n=1 Tax=Ophiocordyceps australis TaxID=1399860 RepID=A0A2C5XVG7_9HYPO|nr:hypothetical protein CDD81_1659 [Ophiocordyceps australis]